MNYNKFKDLGPIKANDEKDLQEGIDTKTYSIDEMPKELVLENKPLTKDDLKKAIANAAPNIDAATLELWTNEAFEQRLQSNQVSNFTTLKLESMNTSAISAEKVQDSKDNSFVPKVQTPIAPQTTIPKDKSGDLTNEGPEI